MAFTPMRRECQRIISPVSATWPSPTPPSGLASPNPLPPPCPPATPKVPAPSPHSPATSPRLLAPSRTCIYPTQPLKSTSAALVWIGVSSVLERGEVGLIQGVMMEVLGCGREVAGLEGAAARRVVDPVIGCARPPQRVTVTLKKVERRWPSAGVAVVARIRPSATAGDRPPAPSKDYDVNEVVEKVVHEEENQLPEEEKKTPEPLPEGEPSPFSPAIDTDDTKTFQGEGVSKDSLVQPPRGLQEGAASASIGEGLGVREESALSADIGGSLKNGPGSHKSRDWRVQSSSSSEDVGALNPRVEKAEAVRQPEKQKQMFGPSEASCDDGSSFIAVRDALENDGGKSVEDYKNRADVFSESADLYSALKTRKSKSSSAV